MNSDHWLAKNYPFIHPLIRDYWISKYDRSGSKLTAYIVDDFIIFYENTDPNGGSPSDGDRLAKYNQKTGEILYLWDNRFPASEREYLIRALLG